MERNILTKKLNPLTEEEKKILLAAKAVLDKIEKEAPKPYFQDGDTEYVSNEITFFNENSEYLYEYGDDEAGDFLSVIWNASQLIENLTTLDHKIKYAIW